MSKLRHLEVLDVHKIHFILENFKNTAYIKKEIFEILNDLFKNKIIDGNSEQIYTELAHEDEYDNKDVIFIKRLLQHFLTNELRTEIVTKLFNKYVDIDEKEFAKQLYLNKDQITEMSKYGMHFGNHTDRHNWLAKLNTSEQLTEIENCLDFLDNNIKNFELNNWSICYPYGSYNDKTLEICKNKGCAVGFTTKSDLAKLSPKNSLKLERFDTNTFPKFSGSEPNHWTQAVLQKNSRHTSNP